MATSDTFVSVVAPLHNDADIVDDFLKELAMRAGLERSGHRLVRREAQPFG